MTRQRAESLIEINIEKGVYRGLGLGRYQGQVVFVPRALPGERARVRIERAKRGYLVASLDQLVAMSPNRRDSTCPYSERCGGCAYREMDYEAQLDLKRAILRETLERGGVASLADGIEIVGSPEDGWRMRCSMHVETLPGGGWRLGLKEERSGRIVDLERCAQISSAMNSALADLRHAIDAHRHLLRHLKAIDLVESADGRRMIAAAKTSLLAHQAVELASLPDRVPMLTGFGAFLSDDRFSLLRGEPHAETSVGQIRYRHHIGSFFQANRFLLARLVEEVVARTPPGGTILDLYSGVGLFALALAARAERVLGAELHPQSFEDAEFNSRCNHLQSRVRFYAGDVRTALAAWPAEPGERIILDPPRTGAGAAAVRAIASRRPSAVVYVSCDPPTLARDLKAFSDLGFRPASVIALDLFPDTFHLETVVQLLPS